MGHNDWDHVQWNESPFREHTNLQESLFVPICLLMVVTLFFLTTKKSLKLFSAWTWICSVTTVSRINQSGMTAVLLHHAACLTGSPYQANCNVRCVTLCTVCLSRSPSRGLRKALGAYHGIERHQQYSYLTCWMLNMSHLECSTCHI